MPGVKISGTVTIGATTITADLTAKGNGATITKIKASWPRYGSEARATASTASVYGSTPAPEGVPY